MLAGTDVRPGLYLFLGLLVAIMVAGCESQPEQPAGPLPADSEVKQFNVVAKNWEFDPDTITVNKGDTVRLSVESIDARHGIAMPAFRISEVLEPGSTVEIEFVADRAGTFDFSCSVPCGSGHKSMKGQLVVNE